MLQEARGPQEAVVLGRTLTQVDNVLLMHVLDAFTYLSHVVDHLSLRHGVALSCDPLKQLATRQAVCGKRRRINWVCWTLIFVAAWYGSLENSLKHFYLLLLACKIQIS